MSTNKAVVRVLYSPTYTDGYVLVWNNSAGTWGPQIQDAYRILNRKISSVAPTDGYALVWSSSTNRWTMGTGSSIRGAVAKVNEVISAGAVNCPLQTTTTGTTSGSSKQISAPDSTGLITLTDGAATFDDTIIGKCVYISASGTGGGAIQNRGNFIIVDRPSITTFRYRNSDGIADSNGITYAINKTITSYGGFIPFARHSFNIVSTTDMVIIKAQLCYTHVGSYVTGSAVQVDGKPVAFNDTASKGAADYFLAISYQTSGLAIGPHVIETGLYCDASYVVFKTGTHEGNTTWCHFDAKTRSIAVILPGASF